RVTPALAPSWKRSRYVSIRPDLNFSRILDTVAVRPSPCQTAKEELLALQGMVRELLSYTINQGLPFPDEFLGKGFKEHLRLAGNAEEALLAVHFHIAELTKQISRLELESDTAFGEWILRLRGMSGRAGWLGYLNLSEYTLEGLNFLGENFTMSRLEDTNLGWSILSHANLSGIHLEEAELGWANLQEANLAGANLKDAELGWADLRDAKLEGANLEGADLTGAVLTGTILENKDS
ncbi:MAG: hypothetical protein D3904_16235, partial [Candidatus Electrothrix sp. EH2]|nr:hypothetical protein [Candidatus Electrothrix sp. EH2]